MPSQSPGVIIIISINNTDNILTNKYVRKESQQPREDGRLKTTLLFSGFSDSIFDQFKRENVSDIREVLGWCKDYPFASDDDSDRFSSPKTSHNIRYTLEMEKFQKNAKDERKSSQYQKEKRGLDSQIFNYHEILGWLKKMLLNGDSSGTKTTAANSLNHLKKQTENYQELLSWLK